MIKILLITIFISKALCQGIYIDSEDLRTVYSLNYEYSSLSEYKDKKNFHKLGLSSLLKSKNQYEFNLYKFDYSKSIETAYTYFIKPEFYLNLNFGIYYRYTFENESSSNDEINDEYGTKFSVYGSSKKENTNSLKFYPIYTYEYIYRNRNEILEKFDIHTVGFSILFNDIGIEPSYSFISKDVNEISIKLYLWEFDSY